MNLSRRDLFLGGAALALAGCGGRYRPNNLGGTFAEPTGDLRFFNAFDDVATARLRVNGESPLPATVYGEASGVDAGLQGAVTFTALNATGAGLASAAVNLQAGARQTVYGFGSGGAHRLLVADESIPSTDSLAFRLIDLIDGQGTRYGLLRRGEALVAVYASTNPTEDTVQGFITIPASSSDAFTFTRQTTGQNPGGTAIGAPIEFTLTTAAPVTLVLYGTPDDVRHTLLKGAFTHP